MAESATPGNAFARTRPSFLPRQLSDAELALFVSAGQRRELIPREMIFRKGELGRAMFVIESGTIQLEFGDGMPDKLIGAREFFGELALFIGNHARVANAVAAETCVLRVIEHAAFESLLQTEAALLAQFMRRSFSYLVASEQQLIQSLKRRNEDLMVTLDSLRHTQTQLSTAERLVRTDELTGLCNRRGLYHYLDELGLRRAAGMRLGLLLIDIDRFKQINDHYGHLTGDLALRAVAAEVQQAAAACDLPCRLGGDEFALLVLVRDANELRDRAMQIAEGVRALRFRAPAEGLQVSVSIGGSLCHETAEWSAWYSDSDCALYLVKGEGGDNCRVIA
ncbi:diguanylate cyclase (GGDEF)-like protein [Tahibacter aquaticus]|uniref:diguanylate cyclase n=1 Tax=Tahibacter aquaticus TaxID=520092 RepID=A0A4R6YSH2_9GAMM|nr:GGDEF domain-containing protein [Tahibacter aquaticus]TDR41201.1 diguanylate cyclase (GGDEF)-like protein [Tahibacter aquaticus]